MDHADHMNMNMDDMNMDDMSMVWNWKYNPVVVFNWLQPSTGAQFCGVILLVFGLGILLEFSWFYLQEYSNFINKLLSLEKGRRASWEQPVLSADEGSNSDSISSSQSRSYNNDAELLHPNLPRPLSPHIFRFSRIKRQRYSKQVTKLLVIRALVYSFCIFLSTINMLMLMTFNGYLIFSSIIGRLVGNFVFSEPFQTPQANDCC